MNLTQQRFYGYLKTPFLWRGELIGLQQFDIEEFKDISIKVKVADTLRLGNYVEKLVAEHLKFDEHIEILEENLQIIDNKHTLGEIDCLLRKDRKPIHIEIAYKFYVYDPTVGTSEIEHFVGPNRRDSLVLKLHKIKTKQFPLLQHTVCAKVLNNHGIKFNELEQQTFFKAQLFLPYNKEVSLEKVNQNCIEGFYVNKKDFEEFDNCKFYIPNKLDWIIIPHTHVNWLNYADTIEILKKFHERKSSPLLWKKDKNGNIEKLFVVFW